MNSFVSCTLEHGELDIQSVLQNLLVLLYRAKFVYVTYCWYNYASSSSDCV